MRTTILAILLISGCATQPTKPVYVIPSEPQKIALPCDSITWYYIDEKLGISVEDFRLLLKCEKAERIYSRDLKKQNSYFRGLL